MAVDDFEDYDSVGRQIRRAARRTSRFLKGSAAGVVMPFFIPTYIRLDKERRHNDRYRDLGVVFGYLSNSSEVIS